MIVLICKYSCYDMMVFLLVTFILLCGCNYVNIFTCLHVFMVQTCPRKQVYNTTSFIVFSVF